MFNRHICAIIFLLTLMYSDDALSHAEHDKARYVAVDGKDQGSCEQPAQPCQSIGYAAKKANKGDKILVAGGEYQAKSVDELFYLTSELVPSYGGYSKADHYKTANPQQNPTYISGVPATYNKQLSERGFILIVDKKSKSLAASAAFQQKLGQFDAIKQSQSDVSCVNGNAGSFPCNNVDLVSHVPLSSFANSPSAANDIWGHVDLNTDIEYAIIGLRNGASVVSLEDPSNPQVVGHVTGLTAIWRDIKVYQYFDFEQGMWQAYAYVSTDGAADSVTIIDLNDLPNSIHSVGHANEDASLHNIYISNVNYGTGVAINHRQPLLHSMGSSRYGGAHRSYDLINPKAPTAVYTPVDATRDDYTHDGTSFVVTDDRVANDCQRLTTDQTTPTECDIFVDFNENEMRLWDQTDKTDLTELGQGIYNNAAYTHSGWWTEDKKYIYVHDELDEQQFNNNTAVMIFDVSDLTAPLSKGRWNGPTKAIDHNGFVRGNRYYMSNYERGMTILDITDPVKPVEIGYFDTFPFSDDDQFNGAWGVYPFLPSGLILISDINSGLYVVKDKTKNVAAGQISFSQMKQNYAEGQTAIIHVQRLLDSTGEISVEYQTLWGSATGDDFVAQTGKLTWADGDNSDKTISIPINSDTDSLEFTEQFSVELFNPQGGATLQNPGNAWIIIDGNNEVSGVKFGAASAELIENQTSDKTQILIPVSRLPSYVSGLNVGVSIVQTGDSQATNNSDFVLHDTMLTWAADDNSDKTITVDIINDDQQESTETVTLAFDVGDNYRIVGTNAFTITILDDDSNTAPTVTSNNYIGETIESLPLGDLVTVSDDQTNLTYQWTLTANNSNATLSTANTLNAKFTTSVAGVYPLTLMVTDPFGESATTSFTVEKTEAKKQDKGGFSFNYLTLFLTTALIFLRRRADIKKIGKIVQTMSK